MLKRNKIVFGLMMVVVLFCLPTNAHAILGAQLYSTGGSMSVEVLPASAGFTSELHLFAPGPDQFIALNTDVGTVVPIGPFTLGEELLFGIYVRNTGDTFYMGPAARNPDGIFHANVEFVSAGVYDVGFEDLFNGGDQDYNDNVFRFRGAISDDPNTHPVPEPASLLLMGLGFLGRGVVRRFKK